MPRLAHVVPLFVIVAVVIGGKSSHAQEDPSHEHRQHLPLPLQFSARVTITAHRVDATKPYPPAMKILRLHYDYVGGRFRAEFEHTMRTVIRRYDQGMEYLVTRIPEEKVVLCRSSKLKEPMPTPEFPPLDSARYSGRTRINGHDADHWEEDLGSIIIDTYFDVKTGAAIRAQIETVEQREPVRLSVPDVTYDVTEMTIGPPPEAVFALPADVKGGESSCERQPNDIGFPYIHFFHHYYRV
eukprot:jgi/Mesvir1/8346/Mv12606-RA.1